ncbi:MAG: hydrolase [Verrucomicrobiae bacterium]|nr:hydrolase [Verrucomicrobiae bacterium]
MGDWRLTAQNAAVIAIDMQEKLMAVMPERAGTLAAADKLLRAARILQLPALVTLQYVKGLGPLCAELSEATSGLPTFEKLTFSCWKHEAFQTAVKELRRQRLLLCGVEAHVCVQQTAIDLMDAGYLVYVCADAVCSRRELDRDVALERIRDCGAVITTVEGAVFELLREAGTPQFKACLPLFR